MFIRVNGDKATLHGIECPAARIEHNNGQILIIVVPGHSYVVGSRHSLLGRGYSPAERQVYRITGNRDDALECELLTKYPVRREAAAA